MVNNLLSLKYTPRRTNIPQGHCSTVDFVVLLLGQAGPNGLTFKQLHAAVAAWRGIPVRKTTCGVATHLTDRTFSYVSYAYDPAVPWPVFFYTFGTNTTSLWYRPKRGVYALNANGLARLRSILSTM